MTSARERRYCCVFGCLNTNSLDLSFFSLPTDNERRLQWLRLIAREDLIDRTSISHRVCEVHFKLSDIMLNATRKLLKKNSLPCLNLPTSTIENTKTDASIQTVMNIEGKSQIKIEPDLADTLSETTPNDTANFQVCGPTAETKYLNYYSTLASTSEMETEGSTSANIHVVNIKHETMEVELPPTLGSETEILQSQSPMDTITSNVFYENVHLDIKKEPLQQLENALFDRGDEARANKSTLTISPMEIVDIPPDPLFTRDNFLIPSSFCSSSTQTDIDKKTAKSLTLERFLTLCDKFLTPKFADLVKMQAQYKTQSKKKGNRYSDEFKSYCHNLRETCPEAYPFLEDLLCLPCARTMHRYRNTPKSAEGSRDQSEETVLNNQDPSGSSEGTSYLLVSDSVLKVEETNVTS